MKKHIFLKMSYENQNLVGKIKEDGLRWIDKMLEKDLTYTKPGSISYLLHGEKPSEQSINIKMGRYGEYLSKELIKINHSLELLNCGIQEVNGKKKDIDLIFQNKEKNIIYYRELKANIELDTEKLPATVNKCKEIETVLKEKYPNCEVDFGILNWSIYSRISLTSGLNHIKTFEKCGIKIDHMGDFLKLIDVEWDEKDYYSHFKDLAERINLRFH
jgi:hypothetical protein